MATATVTQRRIRWNPGERAALIAEGRRLNAIAPMRSIAAIEAAQRVLPKGRQRDKFTTTNIAWFSRAVGTSKGGRADKREGAMAKAPAAMGPMEALGALRASLVAFFADVFDAALVEVRARQRRPAPAAAAAKRGAKVKAARKPAAKKVRARK